jgi:hypothetical protein
MNYSQNQQLRASPFINFPPQPNVIDGNGDFSATTMANHPANTVTIGKHIFVVDSRQRNCEEYPFPSHYRLNMGDVYKNVTSIELKGCILPKSSYNVHSSNKYIDFAIGDGVTSVNMDIQGSGYLVPPTVTISPPIVGIQATGVATIDTSGKVTGVTITLAGSGYSASKPPFIIIDPPPTSGFSISATATTIVGTHYTAQVREGNYVIGGNPDPAVSPLPTDLLLEIQNAMNFAVNGGVYDPVSVTPFVARIVSQYPELGATPGSPEAFDTNACLFNRNQITNVNSDPWEILWCSGPNHTRNMRRIMGYQWIDSVNFTTTPLVTSISGPLIPAGTTYRGSFDFDLIDDPNYVIMSFWVLAEESFDRIASSPEGGLDRAFATLVYDANLPDNLYDLSNSATSSTELIGGVKYLVGGLGKGDFYLPQGTTKPLKGFDFDKKYLEFSPPIGKLSHININFSKYGKTNTGMSELYDFQGRDHMLIFEITMNDQKGQIN